MESNSESNDYYNNSNNDSYSDSDNDTVGDSVNSAFPVYFENGKRMDSNLEQDRIEITDNGSAMTDHEPGQLTQAAAAGLMGMCGDGQRRREPDPAFRDIGAYIRYDGVEDMPIELAEDCNTESEVQKVPARISTVPGDIKPPYNRQPLHERAPLSQRKTFFNPYARETIRAKATATSATTSAATSAVAVAVATSVATSVVPNSYVSPTMRGEATSTRTVVQETAKAKSVAEERAETATKYAKDVYNDPNFANTFSGEECNMVKTAQANSTKYERRVELNHDRFVKIVTDVTAPNAKGGGDERIHEMFTKKVLMHNGIQEDYLFYYNVSGVKDFGKQMILNQALNIWTISIRNKKTGQPIDTSTHSTYIKNLFSSFGKRGVLYKADEFTFKGGFGGVVKMDWHNKRKVDPSIGTNRTKAKFDENVDEKYNAKLLDGTYKPFEDMHDLLKCMVMEFGRQLGIRGKTEMVNLRWSYLKRGTYSCGQFKGLRYVIVAPNGGFDKTTPIGLKNPTVNLQYPMLIEDRNNPFCLTKMMNFYRDRCEPDQERFFCHVIPDSGKHGGGKTSPYRFYARKPVGGDKIRNWVREYAEIADFDDWALYTPHDNRHRLLTILASDVDVPDKARMKQARHKNISSGLPYQHDNSKTTGCIQDALHFGLNRNRRNNASTDMGAEKVQNVDSKIQSIPPKSVEDTAGIEKAECEDEVVMSPTETKLNVKLINRRRKYDVVKNESKNQKRKISNLEKEKNILIEYDRESKTRVEHQENSITTLQDENTALTNRQISDSTTIAALETEKKLHLKTIASLTDKQNSDMNIITTLKDEKKSDSSTIDTLKEEEQEFRYAKLALNNEIGLKNVQLEAKNNELNNARRQLEILQNNRMICIIM